ncbi:MAG: RNA polymerase sigma factor [Vulcanimicrobiaceae bacterium]
MTATAAPFEPLTSVDDAGELLAHCLADDLERCFEQVVRTYQDLIVSLAGRALLDRQRAEEVAQDVFVRAYRALQTYDRSRIRSLRLRSWLFAIAMNLIRNAVRGKHLHLVALERDDGSPRPIPDDAPSPAARVERNEDWQHVRGAIATLSPKLRDAFALRYIEELSYDEIAEALAQPVGTVKANAHRGLMAVRTFLEEQS